MTGPLRLALDQNFPADLIREIAQFLPSSLELRSLRDIDPRLSSLDDRPLQARLVPDRSNVFLLRYQRRKPTDGWDYIVEAAKRHTETPDTLWRREKPTARELQESVLET
jgi:hypothetical protein